MSQLFQPLILKSGQILKNRLFKSAMSEAMGTKDLAPSQDLIALYEYWAKQGIGVLVTGNVMVDSQYLGEPGNVALNSDDQLDLFKRWADIGSKYQTPIWVQLNHPGKQMYKSIKGQPIAPSAIAISGNNSFAFQPPRAMTLTEIKETIDKFVSAAIRAQKTGFTGVQIHAAHGYLINQFLSPADNQRTDSYGGSLNNRMRFLVEIYQGIRAATGDNFSIALKLNALDFKEEGFSFEECQEVVKILSDLGVDLIEISGGNYEAPVFGNEHDQGASFLSYATILSSITDVPIVSTGGFRSRQQMEEGLSSGLSMVGLARPFVLYSDLLSKLKNYSNFKITTPRLTTGITRLDVKLGPIIGVSYYEAQMKRLAQDKNVVQTTNAWPFLISTMRVHGLSALKPRRG